MLSSLIFEKGRFIALSLFLFLLASCSGPSRQWEFDYVATPSPCYNSRQIILPACGQGKNLSLELVSSESGLRMYINIYSLPPAPLAYDESKIAVSLSIDDVVYETFAERFVGGQRLLLPPNATQCIIEALLNEACVSISVGRYKATLVSENFAELLSRT